MRRITKISGKLLEGCIWDEQTERLYFVDIEAGRIYRYIYERDFLEFVEVSQAVGCIVLEKDGDLIAALPDGLYRIDFEKRQSTQVMEIVLSDGIRFNDGKCDANGRLWVGSMAVDQKENAIGAGSLFCVEDERVLKEYPGYTIPNGLAWDEQHMYLYHIDTPKKKVERYQIRYGYELVERYTVLDLSSEEGSPDGMCMDEHGNLWIAMWGGGQVICVDIKRKEICQRIHIPAKYPSCCIFGGKAMDELYITTAEDENGNGGEVYMEKMNVKGVRANRYGQ